MTAAEGAGEPIDVFKFPEEVMEAAEAAGLPLPFAIVGSRESDVIEDEEVPLRHYPWGTCLPLRKEHSDAIFFRYGGRTPIAAVVLSHQRCNVMLSVLSAVAALFVTFVDDATLL